MTVVQVGEHELDYERSGTPGAPPLLLIMGMSGTSLHWGEAFLEELRPSFDVIAFDHRGVGASTPLDGAITIAEMAEDTAGLLAALSIGEAAEFLQDVPLTDRERFIAERVLKEVQSRLGFLVDVGLDYLSLDRAARTLS